MFDKMRMHSVWPSGFNALHSPSLPLVPRKPAAAAPATTASAALMPTGLPEVVPIKMTGGLPSAKVAKGEAGTNVAEEVLDSTELLSTVIKYSLESNAQAPTLAAVAQGWHKQLCFWKQQLVNQTALSKDLKAVQCLGCSPLRVGDGVVTTLPCTSSPGGDRPSGPTGTYVQGVDRQKGLANQC